MRAYVIGNAVVDETYLVDVFPREGHSIHATPRAYDVGGKGANQAVVLARAGLAVTLIAGVGQDARADTVRAALAREPLDVRFVTVAGASTDMSIIMTTPDGGNAIVTTNECAQALDAPTVLPVLEEAAPGDLMVLQGNLSPATTAELFAIAGRKEMPVIFNPSPVHPAFAELIRRASMVFVNEAEAEAYALVGEGITQFSGFADLSFQQIVVTTLGERGAVVKSSQSENTSIHLPVETCDVVDSTGAGDTFQSAFVAALLQAGLEIDGAALRRAGKIAAAAAAISISRYGTLSALPGQGELMALLGEGTAAAR